jgi:hypothetical protein
MTTPTTYLEVRVEIIGILRKSACPVALYAAQYIEGLRVLLTEALDCVDADEQARLESWPQEVECGDLVLDLGDRIREALA